MDDLADTRGPAPSPPPSPDFPPYWGDTAANISAVEEFLATIHREQAELDRVLATVLFTDIVDSTATAAVMGDAKWRELIDEHDRSQGGDRPLPGRHTVKPPATG